MTTGVQEALPQSSAAGIGNESDRTVTGITQEELKKAREHAQNLVEGNLTTSQIRRFLAQVNKFRQKAELCTTEEDWQKYLPHIRMLQPRFAYLIAKNKLNNNPHIQEFKAYVISQLERITSEQSPNSTSFLRFSDYVEAVVAYHKEFGGKD